MTVIDKYYDGERYISTYEYDYPYVHKGAYHNQRIIVYKCPICGTGSKRDLKRIQDKSYQCDSCGVELTKSSSKKSKWRTNDGELLTEEIIKMLQDYIKENNNKGYK